MGHQCSAGLCPGLWGLPAFFAGRARHLSKASPFEKRNPKGCATQFKKPVPPAEPGHFNTAGWQFSEFYLIRTLVVWMLIAQFSFSVAFRAPTRFRPPSFVFDMSTRAIPSLIRYAPAHS